MEQRSTKTIHYRNRKIISYNLNLTSTTISFNCIDLQRGKQENERSYRVVRAANLICGYKLTMMWERSTASAEPNNGKIQEIRKTIWLYSNLWFFKPWSRRREEIKECYNNFWILMKTYPFHYNNRFEKT